MKTPLQIGNYPTIIINSPTIVTTSLGLIRIPWLITFRNQNLRAVL